MPKREGEAATAVVDGSNGLGNNDCPAEGAGRSELALDAGLLLEPKRDFVGVDMEASAGETGDSSESNADSAEGGG